MEKQTQILPITDAQDTQSIAKAAELLRQGGLVVLPTETVYGIGANALDPQAVQQIFAAKGRPGDNPLIVHIAQLEEAFPLVAEFSPQAFELAQAFWPGPLTLILPKSSAVPSAVSAGLETVALRMPAHPICREIIRASGVPVAAPSANRSGRPSPTTAAHCIADLSGRVDMIVDAGSCDIGVESTVLSLVGEHPRLLRPGAVTLEQLQEIVDTVQVDPAINRLVESAEPCASPGMKYKHYAPQAKVVLVHGGLEQFNRYVNEHYHQGVFALVFDNDKEQVAIPCLSYGKENSPQQQARQLFAVLRQMDEIGAKVVYTRPPSHHGMGLAVYNRLIRAAAFEEIFL